MINSPYIIWLTGLAGSGKTTIGQALYEKLKLKYKNLIYLDGDELREILGHYAYDRQGRIDMALKRANGKIFKRSRYDSYCHYDFNV